MPVYVPAGFSPERFAEYEKPYVEFAKMLIEKFSGRPHWGKNRQWAFDLAFQNKSYGENIKTFRSVMDQYDPHGTFSNDFGQRMGLSKRD